MRKLRNLFLVAIAVVGFNVAAQAQEVAHINVSELIPAMPESKAAKTELEKKSSTLDASYKTMVTEYQTKVNKYQGEAATAGDAVNDTRGREVQDMQERIMLFEKNAEKELGEKQLALMKPIMDKAHAAIQKVARAKGAKYVLDSSLGAGVLMADGIDLMADVKKELKMN